MAGEDGEAPVNRYATTSDLRDVENRLTKRIEETNSKGPTYLTMVIAAVACLGSIAPHIK